MLKAFFEDVKIGLRRIEERYNWSKTNIKKSDLKYLDSNVRKMFRFRIVGSTVYMQLRKDSFIYIPKNRKRIKNLQMVQVEVKPIAFSV